MAVARGATAITPYQDSLPVREHGGRRTTRSIWSDSLYGPPTKALPYLKRAVPAFYVITVRCSHRT